MASFFNVGNPFQTPIGQKIEQATDGSLPSESWDLNIEICDMINESVDGPKDAMKAIRKRLTQNAGRNFTAVMYTLTVLETCVKNCGQRFHLQVANKDFLQELIKVIGPKNDPPSAVQEKVLNLVQSWADAFRNIPELSAVQQFYQELKKQKIEFPMTDLDSMAPIHTPKRTQPVPEPVAVPKPAAASPAVPYPAEAVGLAAPVAVGPAQVTGPLPTETIAKLMGDLQVVEGNMTVLSEMLTELHPGKEHPSDLQLLQELYTTCQSMQKRLVELISQLSEDELTAELLRINDALNNIFLRYSRYEKKRLGSKDSPAEETAQLISLNDEEELAGAGASAAGAAAAASSISVSNQLAGLSLASQLSNIPSVNAVNTKDDDFDMFAQSRKNTYESTKSTGSSYQAGQDPMFSESLGASAQARGNVHSERDFEEMAQWLGEKPEESLSSSEFERFLAERAAAAEALPTPATSNTNTSTSETSTARSGDTNRRPKTDDEPMLAL